MFLVLTGNVDLDFSMYPALARSYGPGALVGLPSTITGRPYCATATVTEDADLGFLSPERLESLLRERPDS